MQTVKIFLMQETKKDRAILNSTEFEVEKIEHVQIDQVIDSFVNSLFRRFDAKQTGGKLGSKIPFKVSADLDMLISIDDEPKIQLSQLTTKVGINQIKFPAKLAKEDQYQAKEQLKHILYFAADEVTKFHNEVSEIFE